jgi:hypothetical protein
VEREEAEGKAGVHARKSGAKKAGATSEGLALEQLGALRGEGESGIRMDSDHAEEAISRTRQNPHP